MSIIRAMLSLLALTSLGAAPLPAMQDGSSRQKPPGEGVLCLWAISTAMEEVGRRCTAGQDKEFQLALSEGNVKLRSFVLANSDMTVEGATAFQKQMAHKDMPTAEMCQGDTLSLYELMRKNGAAKHRSSVDEHVAKPGTPSWGACL
ncbi:hypothetical protein P1X14_01705 [Sphingomonas sp. AOB5]|uniref:hypothetical protein n=1 Tax=Sphingomonas sp. AOB5 TaxID=3034017 RepID=UPI0023FA2EDA|nr:hypothetical protein [Sphingomonas sp. AOB5]MDF7773947.1 hypothetical protein [Sphingomonas sp. AOB5]